MTAYSEADQRAQAAPERCRRCYQVEAITGTDKRTRYACRKDQLMHDSCSHFVALPSSREAIGSFYQSPKNGD